MDYPWHLYLMGLLYVIAGINHFVMTKIYLRIMPRYLPLHRPLVYLSGLVEIMLGIGVCVPSTKTISIYGIIAMLTLFLLVHIYMLSSKKAGAGFPKWALIARLLFQFVLMYWAYFYLSPS